MSLNPQVGLKLDTLIRTYGTCLLLKHVLCDNEWGQCFSFPMQDNLGTKHKPVFRVHQSNTLRGHQNLVLSESWIQPLRRVCGHRSRRYPSGPPS